jgi:hypothetical protein
MVIGRWSLVLGGRLRTAAGIAIMAIAVPAAAQTRALPTSLSDSTFWKLVTDISEPGGYFRITDNFTSNEMEVGELFTMLRTTGVTGGVYIGVGPEQNLSYIAAIHPKMAFVVDIRRQAVMQHLMFKAVFELAKDRADFLTLLFAKPRPAGVDTATAIQKMWDAYWPVPMDTALGRKTIERVEANLTKTHHFVFTPDEAGQLRSVLEAFQTLGPAISTRGGSGRGGGPGFNRGFADMTGYSVDRAGQPQSFLSSEENYRYVKSLEDRNLVVPVSGDFGGPKAIRAIGTWLTQQGGVVSAFYLSNVEQYLFQDGKGQAFYDNVATLPIDSKSVFIRPYSMRRFGRGGYPGGSADPAAAVKSLCPIEPFLQAAKSGKIISNDQALACGP